MYQIYETSYDNQEGKPYGEPVESLDLALSTSDQLSERNECYLYLVVDNLTNKVVNLIKSC